MELDTQIFLDDIAGICRATIPNLAICSDNEKSVDDLGLEFLMSGFLFLYDNNTPDHDQFIQLKQTAATSAVIFREYAEREKDGTIEPDEQLTLQLIRGFLYLFQQKVSAAPQPTLN